MIEVGQRFRDKDPRIQRVVQVVEICGDSCLVENISTLRRTLIKSKTLETRFESLKA